MSRKFAAEFLGTFWLVLGGCGSAVLAAGVPAVGIGYAGVALAFGLTVVTGAYAFGHISGAHFNPAVTFGLYAAGRFSGKDILPYWLAQLAGGAVAAAVLYAVASGASGFDASAGFASNGYAEHSPQHYSLTAGLICEAVMTFMFLIVILGATSDRAPKGFAPPCHRACAHPDPSHFHSGNEYLGEPGTLDGRGNLSGKLGSPTALGILAGAPGWSRVGRYGSALDAIGKRKRTYHSLRIASGPIAGRSMTRVRNLHFPV